MEKKRSLGVTILGVYLSLCAIPSIFAAIIGGISGSQAKTLLEVFLDIIMRILFISSPVVLIVAAAGIFKLKNWARIMTMFLSPILSFIDIGILGIFLDTIIPPNIVSLTIACGMVVMSIAIIYYLTRPSVKAQFKPGGPNA